MVIFLLMSAEFFKELLLKTAHGIHTKINNYYPKRMKPKRKINATKVATPVVKAIVTSTPFPPRAERTIAKVARQGIIYGLLDCSLWATIDTRAAIETFGCINRRSPCRSIDCASSR